MGGWSKDPSTKVDGKPRLLFPFVVIAGGVIPKQDYPHLYDAGVKCVFGPGTPIPVCAREVLDAVNQAQA